MIEWVREEEHLYCLNSAASAHRENTVAWVLTLKKSLPETTGARMHSSKWLLPESKMDEGACCGQRCWTIPAGLGLWGKSFNTHNLWCTMKLCVLPKTSPQTQKRAYFHLTLHKSLWKQHLIVFELEWVSAACMDLLWKLLEVPVYSPIYTVTQTGVQGHRPGSSIGCRCSCVNCQRRCSLIGG